MASSYRLNAVAVLSGERSAFAMKSEQSVFGLHEISIIGPSISDFVAALDGGPLFVSAAFFGAFQASRIRLEATAELLP